MSTASSNGTALITGASRGMGAIYANRLAERGYELFLARDATRLRSVADRLAKESGRRVTARRSVDPLRGRTPGAVAAPQQLGPRAAISVEGKAVRRRGAGVANGDKKER